MVTETRPKITALEFQGNFEDGNLRWEIQGNPMLIEVERTWNFKFSIHQNMPHWTATICWYCRWKTVFKTVTWWHRLRPPAVVVLDVHRGLRRQQQLGALHAAVECCKMQRSPTSAPQASEAPPAAAPRGSELPGRRCSGRPRPRPSPGERRRPPCGRSPCCLVQRGLAAAPRPRPRRVGRGSAGRGAGGPAPPPGRRRRAARAMLSSRRAEKCSRNEVPQFLWSLCSIFSKSKSATYGNYIEIS